MLIVCLVLVCWIALISLVFKLLHVNIIGIITVIAKIVEIHLSVTIKIINYFKSVPIAFSLRYLGRTAHGWYFSSSLFKELIIEFGILALFEFMKFLLVLFDSSVWEKPFQKVDSLICLDYLLSNRLIWIFTNFFILTRHIVLLLRTTFLLVNNIFKDVVRTSLELFVLYYST